MSLIKRFLREQDDLAVTWSYFLSSLNRGRTMTLRGVLSSPHGFRRLSLGHIFSATQLRQRIIAYCDYVNRTHGGAESLRKGCLVFFQSNRAGEDGRQPVMNPRYKSVPAQVRYFHTETEWTSEAVGSWERNNRVIKPGHAFSNQRWHGLYPAKPEIPPQSQSVIGYRLPIYTDLLGVCSRIATDYLARMVVHDLGHAHLPDVEGDGEPLHDVAMVRAMNARTTYPRTFAGIVHQECTDPFFFLDPSILWEIDDEGLSVTQRFFLRALREKYSDENLARMGELFELTRDVTEENAREHVTGVLDRMRAGRYSRYRMAA